MAAKKKPIKQSTQAQQEVTVQPVVEETKAVDILANRSIPYLIIFLFTCAIYSNTLYNKYAIDDSIVITDNNFTKKGFAGIHDLMTTDAFVGFFGERGSRLVAGGRYRPLSIVTFAVEYQFFGLNPAISHAVNVLLFACTGMLLFYMLSMLLKAKKDTPFYLTIPFIATMIYMAHPIHTEAVANIKGRDEIMSFLFSIGALVAAVKYVRTQNLLHLLWGAAVLFLGLLSKENSITFFAIIPLTFYFFTHAKVKDYVLTLIVFALPVGLFLFMRSQFTSAGIAADSPEILNNPFLLANSQQRYATTILTFLYYIKLLIFPHPLSHDYYFNQIPYVDFGDPKFVLSIVVNGGLLIYAALTFRKKNLASFAILFYFITFSIVSNLLFTVGVMMSERFIYMASFGFCLLLGYLIVKLIERVQKTNPDTVRGVSIGMIVLLSLYSLKTYTRNFVWENNFKLFSTDIDASPGSAKLQTSLGGDLVGEADKQRDTTRRKDLLKKSISHLNEALRIYPTHSNAWLLLGNASYKLNRNFEEAITIYRKAMECRVGGYYDAFYNLGCVYAESGKYDSAKNYFVMAVPLKPEMYDCKFNLADAYAKLNMPDSAIYYFNACLQLRPDDGGVYYRIGTCYGKQKGDLDNAIANIKRATELSPKVPLYFEDLGVAYGMKGQFDASIKASEDLIKIDPKYPAAYMNLSISYRNKGNKQLADQYLAKAQELNPAYKR